MIHTNRKNRSFGFKMNLILLKLNCPECESDHGRSLVLGSSDRTSEHYPQGSGVNLHPYPKGCKLLRVIEG